MTSDPFSHFVNLWLLMVLLVPAYYALKSAAARENLLALTGAYLVFITGPRFLMFWLAYWLMIYGLARALMHYREKENEQLVMGLAVTFSLLPLVLWKLYGETFLFPVNETLHNAWSVLPALGPIDSLDTGLLVPLGLSYASFRAMDLLAAVFLGLLDAPSLRRTLFFGFFPPVLVLGPIIQYREIDKAPPASADESEMMAGLYRILIGLVKLYLIALPLAFSVDTIANYADTSVAALWGAVAVHAWYFYLNFSAYSDLAIGSARVFGYRIAENFSFPYFRENLQQFWAHWHMSLTGLAQRLVFVPLGGYRKNRQYLAIFLTMMVIALWHDISIPLVTFGCVHAATLIGLRWVGSRRDETKSPGTARRAMGVATTFLFVAATLPMLVLDSAEFLSFYARLFFGS